MGEVEEIIRQRVEAAFWSPPSGPVDWTQDRIGQMKDQAQATVRAILSALDAAGYAVVRKEPDEASLHAAFVAMNATPSGTWKRMKAEKRTPKEIFVAKMIPRYRAMIAAQSGRKGE
jgi:hypothetical protein